MPLPDNDTPLYNHPLPQIEQWLRDRGCQQDEQELNTWHLERPAWQAEIALEIEELAVRYLQAGDDGRDIVRSFKYSLSRSDIEAAVFDGP